MSEARFIAVPLASGKTAHVRVISYHPDDDKLRLALYEFNGIDDYAQKHLSALSPTTDPQTGAVLSGGEADLAKARKRLADLAALKIESDTARLNLFLAVLTQKHSGEEVKEMMRDMTAQEYVDIFYACQGQEPSAALALAQLRRIAVLCTEEQIESVQKQLTSLREAWKAASNASAKTQTAPTGSTPT